MKNIFIGNLDFGATEDSVRQLFEQFGTVDRVNMIRDRDTGQPRGFAFVEMSDASEADRAISALNGSQFGGRSINVNEARPKVERAGSGFAGNRGGGGGFNRGGGGGRGRGRREPRW